MQLLSIKASKVFSIDQIELSLKDNGLLLINGWSFDENNENGAGKSSIANKALTWGLYGRTANKFKADSVINRHLDGKNCFVEVSFIGSDGIAYTVKRQRNPNRLTLTTANSFTDLSQKLEKDTQAILEKLLGRSYETFIQADFFGQGRKASFFELSPSEQVLVVEQILPLSQLEIWAETAKVSAKQTKEVLNKLQADKRILDLNISNFRTEFANCSGRYIHFENDKANKLKALEEKVNIQKEEKAKAIEEIKKLEEQASEFSEVLATVFLKESIAYRDQSQNHYANLTYDIKELKKEINDLGTGICSACKQTLPDCDPEQIKLIKISKEEEINQLESNCVVLKDYLISIEAVINKAQAEIYKSNGLHQIIDIKKNQDNDKVITVLLEQLEEIKRTQNPYGEIQASYHEKILKVQEQKKSVEIQIKKVEEEVEIINNWVTAYGSHIKSMLIEKACPFLEQQANSYLTSLNNSQIKIGVSTDKQLKSGDSKVQFVVTARSETGGEEFGLLSGGEQQIASFAFGLALSDLAETQSEGSSNVLILDEPFTNLSSKNAEAVVEFLTGELSKRKSTILLISNEDHLKNIIPNRILVEKRAGVSNLADKATTSI